VDGDGFGFIVRVEYFVELSVTVVKVEVFAIVDDSVDVFEDDEVIVVVDDWVDVSVEDIVVVEVVVDNVVLEVNDEVAVVC
jgi:hypothetical protein